METCAFFFLCFEAIRELGPGEAVFICRAGLALRIHPGDRTQICSFLWIYYGYPASDYEGINVEHSRYCCGAKLAQRDKEEDIGAEEFDFAAGIPDSGIAHALGYAQKKRIQYSRPFVKYTPTWARSFLPQNQTARELVAKMKLIPIKRLTSDKRILFCDDSIVNGTQLKDTLQRIYAYGAREIHMRLACPPLFFKCKYLTFSRSKSEMDLVTRKTIAKLEGGGKYNIEDYINDTSDKHIALLEYIRSKMNLTSLKFQRLNDMVDALGVPPQNLCTYCWTGCENAQSCAMSKSVETVSAV
jgi:amidophosphoribosyltransferase